jgi:hypothetical protein
MIDDNEDFMAVLSLEAVRDSIDKFIVVCNDDPQEDNLKALCFFLNLYFYTPWEGDVVEGS